MMKVAVVGGGAAGFFAALSVKEHHPQAQVTIFEKSGKLLSKVRISGGGRCNVTHHCYDIKKFARHYPRGERFLRKAFQHFAVKDTVEWFERRGVELKIEEDGRMFPTTDRSQTIIDALMSEAARLGVSIQQPTGITACVPVEGKWKLSVGDGRSLLVDGLIISTGGNARAESYKWLSDLGHAIVPPVPSLFTFNMPGEPIRDRMGLVADPVHAGITGTTLASDGPLLITHWGMSGPAILKLSAWGARLAAEMGYRFTLRLNWLGGHNESEARSMLREAELKMGKKHMANADPFALPDRLWKYLLEKAGIPEEKRLAELAKKERNRLVDLLTNDRYEVKGKTTFKEEFVTAGGISLDEVDPITMRSLKHTGLYFAGEVLDIDGITGGFNFQAAWTTGYLAGKLEQPEMDR